MKECAPFCAVGRRDDARAAEAMTKRINGDDG